MHQLIIAFEQKTINSQVKCIRSKQRFITQVHCLKKPDFIYLVAVANQINLTFKNQICCEIHVYQKRELKSLFIRVICLSKRHLLQQSLLLLFPFPLFVLIQCFKPLNMGRMHAPGLVFDLL